MSLRLPSLPPALRRVVRASSAVDLRAALGTFLRRDLVAFLTYAVAIAIVTPPVVGWHIRVAFYAYALMVFWIVWWHLRMHPVSASIPARGELRFFRWLLASAFLLLLVTRISPFLRYGIAPLGYDTGFYLSSLGGSFNSILAGYGHRNYRALALMPLEILGIPRIVYFHAMTVLVQLAIAGAMYALARTIGVGLRVRYAAVVVLLFAASIPQFFAFWWAYYQTAIAIAFLLITLALVHRRSWLAALTGVLGAAIHPATFLPAAVALVVFMLLQLVRSLIRMQPLDRETRFLLILGVVGTLFAQTRVAELRAFILVYTRETLVKHGWLWTHYPLHEQPQFTGLYVDRSVAQLADIYILPFAILGVIAYLSRRLRHDRESYPIPLRFLLVWLVILTALALVPVIYQHRWLIYLDLTLILFAAYPIVLFIHRFFRDRVGKVVLALLIGGLAFHASLAVAGQRPQLYPDERAEIVALASRAEDGAYAMVTESQYTPWLIAFTSLPILDPGYLRLSEWSYDVWNEFWNGKSNARRHELLRMYDRPLYIFTGRTVRHGAKYMQFIRTDPRFERIGEYFWRYDPRALSDADIEAMRAAEENAAQGT